MGRSHQSGDTFVQQVALFALMVGLWSLNLFPIQRAEPVLTASALVSEPRLPSLQRVSQQRNIQSDSIRWVHYQRDLRRASQQSQSNDLHHIQLRLGIRSNASFQQIQKELDRLTEPTIESEGQASDQVQLRAERWRLKTIEHQMARFELDRTREEQALESTTNEYPLADQASGSERGSTPAQTVTYRKLNSESVTDSIADPRESPNDQKTWESLLSDFDRCAKRIDRIENQLHLAQVQAFGTIEITGSPHLGVLSTGASMGQSICVLTFTLLSCAGLFVYLRVPSPQRLVRSQKSSMLEALNELGLKNFGTIDVTSKHSASSEIPSVPPAKLSDLKPMRSPRRIVFVRRIVDSLLVVWVACFALRFLSDANWRELLFGAPLSAFSSLVLGL
ncbi:MAG: hypothetical protein ACKN9S_08245 [Pirellula sp.]